MTPYTTTGFVHEPFLHPEI